MVLLTMTTASVATLQECIRLDLGHVVKPKSSTEPSLEDPKVGKPISHGQLIDISRHLNEHYQENCQKTTERPYHLDVLLRGSKVYVPPPPPKKEPTDNYKALMARLRKDDEARQYEQFSNSSNSYPSPSTSKEEEDEVTYADVNRQLALIVNVLVSIIACSFTIWMAARHWSVPPRLALSLCGSGVVAAAEVAIYSGYIRRVKEAKDKEKNKVEQKEIIQSWVIGASEKKPTGRRALNNGQVRNGKESLG